MNWKVVEYVNNNKIKAYLLLGDISKSVFLILPNLKQILH